MEWMNQILLYQIKHQYTDREMAFRLRITPSQYITAKQNPYQLKAIALRLRHHSIAKHELPHAKGFEQLIHALDQRIPSHLYERLLTTMSNIHILLEKEDHPR